MTSSESILIILDLRSLDLSHNQLTQLPESFGDLINLEEFYCNANRLNQFPCLNQCTRLKVKSARREEIQCSRQLFL